MPSGALFRCCAFPWQEGKGQCGCCSPYHVERKCWSTYRNRHTETTDTGPTLTNTQASTAIREIQAHRYGAVNTQGHGHRDMATCFFYTPEKKRKHTWGARRGIMPLAVITQKGWELEDT